MSTTPGATSAVSDAVRTDPAGEAAAIGSAVRRRSVVGNAFMLMASQGITWVFAFVLAIVQPRYLGPAATGQLRIGFSLWTMAEVFIAFGMPTLLTLEVARGRAGRRMLGDAILLQLVMYVVSWVGILGFALVADYERSTVAVIAIIGASSVFTCLGGSGRAILLGLERMEFIAAADVVAKATFVLVVVSLLILGAGVRSVAVMAVAGSALNAALLFIAVRRFPEVSFRGQLKSIRPLLKRARPYLLIDATLVIYQQLDVVVISLMLGPAPVGWYSSANALFGSLLFVPTILMTSLFPVLARLSSERPDAMLPALRRSFINLMAIAIPAGLGTAMLATRAAVLLFGKEFAGTGPVLAVMGVALIATFPTILFGRFALAIGRQRFWATLMVIATVATVPLDLVLVPWTERTFGNGATGGAVATVVTETFLVIAGVVHLAPRLFDRDTIARLLKCAAAGGLMCVVVWPLRSAFIAIPVAAGGLVYVVTVVALRTLDARDMAEIRSLTARAPWPIGERRRRGAARSPLKESDAKS